MAQTCKPWTFEASEAVCHDIYQHFWALHQLAVWPGVSGSLSPGGGSYNK